jgi:hypothetical protein
MASIHSQIPPPGILRTKPFLLGSASAIVIGILVIALAFTFAPQSTSNNFVPNISNEVNDTVLIKTVGAGSHNVASAQIPWKVESGRVVTFFLDIQNSSPSVNSLAITITGYMGQYLLYLPYSHDGNNHGRVEFQYVFPAGGIYNIDIGFGAPEGINFNIPVASE